jgi:hypothetical protein
MEGADRYKTATRIAQYGVDECGCSWDWGALTTGEQFPDALAGGSFGNHAGLLLITPSDSLHPDVEAKYSTNAPSITHLFFLGGNSALSQDVRDEAMAALN